MVHQVADWGYKYIERSRTRASIHFINTLFFSEIVKLSTGRY